MYDLGDNCFSVFHHKHFRVVCERKPGVLETHWPIISLNFLKESLQSVPMLHARKARSWATKPKRNFPVDIWPCWTPTLLANPSKSFFQTYSGQFMIIWNHSTIPRTVIGFSFHVLIIKNCKGGAPGSWCDTIRLFQSQMDPKIFNLSKICVLDLRDFLKKEDTSLAN